MGPPDDVPPNPKTRVTIPKPYKGKSTKEPPTLKEVKAKTVPGLITYYQLRQIRKHYGISDELKTRIPFEGENVDAPSTQTEAPKEGTPEGTCTPLLRDTSLFWDFFNYGLRLPVSGFGDEVLVTLDRFPG
ncbi:hypothetical protein LIER_33212 [Lithospermum erythrorhizon]|uniref:Uncharacterized protein n=1 Tax=Lithospermum erythrorhizon TaxID=34254 RepID=A0AAV3RY98_LITER